MLRCMSCILAVTFAFLESICMGEFDSNDENFFRDRVQPILVAKCLSCHGPKIQKSGYRLDTRAIALRGGDHGEPPIVPGSVDTSLLLRYVTDENSDMAMPPKESLQPRLTLREVASLQEWIERGAIWPDSDSAPLEDPLDWWSFKPLHKKPIPSSNPIDFFVKSKLSDRGLTMSAPADARTLCRRLYFDLIGLPPTPDELDTFVHESGIEADTALDALIEKLLAMPQYGERWARHWLDVVHYGDTHGYDKDKPRPNAWPYRDYVIRVFNEDKPYSRFIEEQIAGDVLWPNTRDGIEALGFIAAGPWDFIGHAEVSESKIDGKIARHLDRDDMVSNTIGSFCSVTVHCAQCHQHKFDPISQEDYYRLHAVFSALDRTDRKYYREESIQKQFLQLERLKNEATIALKQIEDPLKEVAGDAYVSLSKRIESASKSVDKNANSSAEFGYHSEDKERLVREREALLISSADDATRARRQMWLHKMEQLVNEFNKLPAPSLVYLGGIHNGSGTFAGTGATGGKPRPIYLLARGQVTQPLAEMSPGSLSALTFRPFEFALEPNSSEGERRVALAHWVSDPSNPLTWRSIVNRVWLYHFGRGFVDTPNDIGHNGGLPTHPELLDWLAADFRDSGGSLKRLHRLIIKSETYRQSSSNNADGLKLDSNNTLLWKQNRRRLEAEAIRDSVLAVSGTLDKTMGGPGWQDFVVEFPDHSPHYEYGLADPEDTKTWRRSIYRFIVRSQTQPWMTSLDCADPSTRVDKRNESLSSIQALALLNNGFILTQAKHFADRVGKQSNDISDQVEVAHRLAFGHAPSDGQRAPLIEFAKMHGVPYLCRMFFNLNAFTFVD